MSVEMTIASRFCGPASSGNGGYTAGTLAEQVPGRVTGRVTGRETGRDTEEVDCPVVEVTLRQPPPLEVAMRVQHWAPDHPGNATGSELTVLVMGGAKIAEARLVADDLDPVEAVAMSEAAAAMARFPGLVSHPFTRCFSCGPDRAEGDGLRIFPGPVADGRVASLWVPHPPLAESSDLLDPGQQRVGLGVAWAALDCVGGWAGDMEERSMVLGRMTAQVDALPVVGEPHVVVGAARGSEGRKTSTASTLYDSDGRIVARAQHVWVAVDPADFG
jgi:hypothetical protein